MDHKSGSGSNKKTEFIAKIGSFDPDTDPDTDSIKMIIAGIFYSAIKVVFTFDEVSYSLLAVGR